FRRLARAYHPDVSGADTASRFREILEAWEVLGDVRQRRDYDERARRQRAPRLAKRAHAWPAGRRQPPAKPRTTAARMEAPGVGGTLHLELRLSRAEAALGGDIAVALPAVGPCPHCGGLGQGIWSICHVCQGTGSCVQLE